MKYLSFLLLLSLFIAGCADTPPRPAPVMTQAQHDAINAESAALEAQKAAQVAAAKASSPSSLHYYCSAHPDKGGADQGTCPECGLALVHNQAFHNTTSLPGSPVTSTSVPPAPAAATGSSVFHYTCPNGCAGGAADQADCTVCGTPLAHNQAYHNTAASTETALTPPTVPTTPSTSAVNDSGVYHYTCSNGCAGGAAAQADCAVCGNPLAHNQAYHN